VGGIVWAALLMLQLLPGSQSLWSSCKSEHQVSGDESMLDVGGLSGCGQPKGVER
jgi:hypothetical protein